MLIRCCDDGRAEGESKRGREGEREGALEGGMKGAKKRRALKRQSERGKGKKRGATVEDEENRENDRMWCSDSFSNCKNPLLRIDPIH